MKVVCIIPARLASTRLLKKPLVDIADKPLIRRVYEKIANIKIIDEVIIAADDDEIVDVVRGFGGRVTLTPKELSSGTDRTAYVCRDLCADVIVNVQCDEPFIRAEMIEAGLKPFIDGTPLMGSLKTRIKSVDDLFNPNVVKVVTDSADRALYFSRSPIPYFRDRFSGISDHASIALNLDETVYYKHLGIYFYNPDFLQKFSNMPPSYLEEIEKLEQLRALESGYDIVVPTTEFDSIGIDTAEDLARAREIFNRFY